MRAVLTMYQRHVADLSESREQAVRAEVSRLLDSPAFRTSKRCREFLEHVVERTIHGPADALKERSIGVELFKLPLDFDTGQHTVVRVTANEVRKKLAQHYLAENGSHRPVRIDLPPGSYSAEFRWETPTEETSTEETQPAETPINEIRNGEPSAEEKGVVSRPIWRARPRMALVTVALVIAGVCAFWVLQPMSSVSMDVTAISAASPLVAALPAAEDLRFMVGSSAVYTDRSGRKWGPDQFYSGGTVRVRPSEKIARTLDPDIYRHSRVGEFRYDIPLEPGSYELHLHFAETGLSDFISAESSGEGQRVFHVSVNGQRILDLFDVVADAAGSNVADERVLRDISPADDGFLHLSFSPVRGSAMLSGIEVLPVKRGSIRPVRIRAGWTASWQDSRGKQWQADSYFLGGNALVRRSNPVQQANSIPPEMAIYGSERWGHFSYAVPVADGRYRVNLRFSEGHYGSRNTGIGGIGSRLFDVYCNGVALLRNFDILKEAGGEARPVDRSFSGIRPTAQGKILLTFVPVKGMACVNGIEIEEER